MHRCLVERSDEQVGEWVHRLARDQARLHRRLERRLDEPQAVLSVDLTPLVPAEDAGGVGHHDLLHRGVDAGVEEGLDRGENLLPLVGLLQSGRGRRLRQLARQVVEHGAEQVLLAAEVVVERAARDAGALDDLLRADACVPVLREKGRAAPEQLRVSPPIAVRLTSIQSVC